MEILVLSIVSLNILVVTSQEFVLDKASDVDGRMWRVHASRDGEGSTRDPFDFKHRSLSLSGCSTTVYKNKVPIDTDFRSATQLVASLGLNFEENATLAVCGEWDAPDDDADWTVLQIPEDEGALRKKTFAKAVYRNQTYTFVNQTSFPNELARKPAPFGSDDRFFYSFVFIIICFYGIALIRKD